MKSPWWGRLCRGQTASQHLLRTTWGWKSGFARLCEILIVVLPTLHGWFQAVHFLPAHYNSLQVKKSPKLARLLLQIENPVTNYKPVASHSYHVRTLFSVNPSACITLSGFGPDPFLSVCLFFFVVLFCFFFPATARVWEEKEGGGPEDESRQAAGFGHVVLRFWEAPVL